MFIRKQLCNFLVTNAIFFAKRLGAYAWLREPWAQDFTFIRAIASDRA